MSKGLFKKMFFLIVPQIHFFFLRLLLSYRPHVLNLFTWYHKRKKGTRLNGGMIKRVKVCTFWWLWWLAGWLAGFACLERSLPLQVPGLKIGEYSADPFA